MTDPNVGYKTLGWYDPARGEIGDITEQYLTRLNGYLVQQVAGKNDQPLPLTSVPPQPPAGVTATQSFLLASASQIRVGQTVTLTLTVAAASGSSSPTGVVTLMDGNRVLGTVNLGAGGKVVVTLSANAGSTGTHSIKAVYAGNSSFQGSASNTFTLTVLPRQFIPFPIWIFGYHRRIY
jgi:hypothetical protein